MNKIYKVTYKETCLYFIAEDRDHLMTLISTELNSVDYAAIVRDSRIEQVAGFISSLDDYNFYKGLL